MTISCGTETSPPLHDLQVIMQVILFQKT